jgi:hypothetical protein
MRILSFILAFGVAFAAPSFNATAESGLPGVGTFRYATAQSERTDVAHLTLTARGKQLPGLDDHARDTTRTTARG